MLCKTCISSRLKVGILGTIACSLVYSLRVNLSVAIVAMVNQTMIDRRHPEDTCSVEHNETNLNNYPSGSFDWTESEQGIILGAYFYGYTSTQIIGGRFTERWGAKWVCGAGIMIPAIINALSPLAAETDIILLICSRIIIGMFHGLIFSSLFSMYAKWFPKQERTSAIAATLFGGNIGAIIISPLSGFLCQYGPFGGWPSVFYIGSSIHIIWLIFWYLYASDSPEDHRNISPEEHLYILQNIDCQPYKSKAPAPWKSILTSPVVYASVFAKTSGTFGYYVLLTKLPSYFDSIFNIEITYNGFYTALVYLAIGITLMIAGRLSTFVKRKSGLSLTVVRKLFQGFASLGPALCLALVPACNCNVVPVIILIVTSMCLYGFITGGEYPIILEFAPEFSGTVFGFSNTFASSTGFLAPIIVGFILDSDSGQIGTREKWNLVFYITSAVYVVGLIFFEIFGSAESQPWAKLPETHSTTSDGIQMSEIGGNISKKFSIRKIFLKHKQNNTDTPEWKRFKKTTYVL